MSKSEFPAGWDEERVQAVIDHYENLSEDEAAAEDDAAAAEQEGRVVVSVSETLMPAIRELIARENSA